MTTNRDSTLPEPAPVPAAVFVLYSDAYPSNYDRGPDEFLGVFATEAAAHAGIVALALAGAGIQRARVERAEVKG